MQQRPDEAATARLARRADKPAAIATLAEAFQYEPAFSFILPDPAARRDALRRAFKIIVREDMGAGAVLMTPQAEAVTAWRSPHRMHETRWERLRTQLPYMLAFGSTIERAALVGGLIKQHLPQEGCWYLHYAGCHAQHRGKGYGGAVIRAGLERADAERSKAYLETADEANLAIYRALGFEIVQTWQVPDGPHFWGMMRAAR
jgi:ribosomal protein S18 acetylase RimI-like enzyme